MLAIFLVKGIEINMEALRNAPLWHKTDFLKEITGLHHSLDSLQAVICILF